MPAKRAAVVTVFLAAVGLGISGVIASVHHQLARSSTYTSFCNVNERVNCDVVLSSDYAYFAGTPIAWWAALTYALVIAAGVFAIRSARATRRRQAASVLFAVGVGSFLYSIFLAYIALGVLHAVCLLCAGLYLVNAGLLVSTWLLLAAVRSDARAAGRRREESRARTRLIAGGAALAVVALLAVAGWEAGSGTVALSPEEFARKYPDFYEWYMRLPVVTADLPGGHAKGERSARVNIVEFSDFECAHCARAYRTLKAVLPRFKNDVQLVFHHYPLDSACNPAIKQSFHRYACLAAMAAECAGEQGRFWEYHDLLFENQSALDRDSLIGYAERAGIDRARFLACLDTDAPRRAVERDVADAVRVGVQSTPTFFLNGRTLAGALDPAKLEYAIRLERAAKAEKAQPNARTAERGGRDDA